MADPNPYTAPGVNQPDPTVEDYCRRWQSVVPDLSHGISLSGRLTDIDQHRAANTAPFRPGCGCFTFLLVAGAAAAFFISSFFEPAGPMPQVQVPLMDESARLISAIFVFFGLCLVVVPGFAFIRFLRWWEGRQWTNYQHEPAQWLFQRENFYALRSTMLEVYDWSEFRLLEYPDLLSFENRTPSLGRLVFPRRFAGSDEEWTELVELARGKLPPLPLPAAPVRVQLPQTEETTTSHEEFSFVDSWSAFNTHSPLLLSGAGRMQYAEAVGLIRPYENWWLGGAMFALPTIVAVAIAAIYPGHPRSFCSGVICSHALAMFLLIYVVSRQRKHLRQLLDATKPGAWGLHETFVESCTDTHRSIYLWKGLSRGPETEDMRTLLVGRTNLMIPLSRRYFSPSDWHRLIARLERLPLAGEVTQQIVP